MASPLTKDKAHNPGIDLVRIIAMLMVVTLHTLGQGELLFRSPVLSVHYEVIWGIEILAVCACNCFAIVSGYVGVKSRRIKYANLAAIWLQVVFFTVGITCIYALLRPEEVDKSSFIEAFTPVTSNTYWYFTAYFVMFFFTPALNYAANHLKRGELLTIIIFVGVIFTILDMFTAQDVFLIADGYSPLWLMYLYLIGAYIKLNGRKGKHNTITNAAVYICMVAVSWGVKLLCESHVINHAISEESEQYLFYMNCGKVLIQYNSPTMLIAAIAVVCLCKELNFHRIGAGIISFFAPAAFGVYIIHRQPIIWDHFITNRFVHYADDTVGVMVMKIVMTVITIYCICTLIEWIRIKVFDIMRVKQILSDMEFRMKERFY